MGKFNIGIIGQGFVGSAVKAGFELEFNVHTYDVIPEKRTCDSIADLLNIINATFVCVPTPMKKSGECDLSIVESVLSEINEWGTTHPDHSPIAILKSTVPVGTCDYLQEKYKNLILVFNPEFLTEANAIEDFKNQHEIVIGVNEHEPEGGAVQDYINGLFAVVFSSINTNITMSVYRYKEAEMIKYVSNCFLATKVSFANQMNDACIAAGVSYPKILYSIKNNPRLGTTHWDVPGPDGDRGYGGHCFPKDMAAMAFRGDQLGIDMTIIKEAIRYNDSIRTDRNWESMKGRAVSDE